MCTRQKFLSWRGFRFEMWYYESCWCHHFHPTYFIQLTYYILNAFQATVCYTGLVLNVLFPQFYQPQCSSDDLSSVQSYYLVLYLHNTIMKHIAFKHQMKMFGPQKSV